MPKKEKKRSKKKKPQDKNKMLCVICGEMIPKPQKGQGSTGRKYIYPWPYHDDILSGTWAHGGICHKAAEERLVQDGYLEM